MILKQPQVTKQTDQNTETNTTKKQQIIHQCVTCKKTFSENKNLATHRANKPACKLIWKTEYDTQRTCQNQDCGEKFPTVEKCKKNTHTLYHCHKKYKHIPQQNKNGEKRQANNSRKRNTSKK